jgi:hypothetical protein
MCGSSRITNSLLLLLKKNMHIRFRKLANPVYVLLVHYDQRHSLIIWALDRCPVILTESSTTSSGRLLPFLMTKNQMVNLELLITPLKQGFTMGYGILTELHVSLLTLLRQFTMEHWSIAIKNGLLILKYWKQQLIYPVMILLSCAILPLEEAGDQTTGMFKGRSQALFSYKNLRV